MIDPELIDILACPACQQKVGLEENTIICSSCGRAYPIREGIPVMLPEDIQENHDPLSKGRTA